MKYNFDNVDKVAIKVSIYVVLSFTVIYILSGIVNVIPTICITIINALLYTLGVLKPLWIGLIIAYLVYPIAIWVNRMLFKEIIKRRKKKRDESFQSVKRRNKMKMVASIFITYVLIIWIIVTVVIMGFGMVKGKLASTNIDSVVSGVQNYMGETRLFLEANLQTRLNASHLLSEQFKTKITEFVTGIGNFGTIIVDFIINFFTALMNNLLSFLLGIVIAFYIMADVGFFKRIYKVGQRLILPEKYCVKMNKFLGEIDEVISKFIRGQLLDCLIVAAISIIALSLIGLDFAFFVGLFVGLSNIIPYFGPAMGAGLAVIVGILSPEPIKALYALIVILIIQQLDGNIMAPRIVGRSVGLHPVFILLAVIIGAQFSLVGMILAVPTAAVIKLVILKLVGMRKRKIEG
ncbi:MAG: hypothetical protein A2Y24_01040 [Clostridiales bacterium GWE2_32_10]|nr:MAG: hypothetical protein A2Y24_01040 [Clostridiales bacterium GWE2_32_10]